MHLADPAALQSEGKAGVGWQGLAQAQALGGWSSALPRLLTPTSYQPTQSGLLLLQAGVRDKWARRQLTHVSDASFGRTQQPPTPTKCPSNDRTT